MTINPSFLQLRVFDLFTLKVVAVFLQARRSIEGDELQFSRLWLYFDSPHEKEFLAHLNGRRSLGSLDTTLFALSSLFSLASIPRTIKRCSANELHLLVSCFFFSLSVTILFHYRYSPRGAFIRSKRIYLHITLHALHHLQTLQMLAKPEMVACANSRPMVEFLVLWWVFQALYSSVAAIPLLYAVPLQLTIAITMLFWAPPLCANGFQVCTAAPQLYLMLSSVFSTFSMIISFPLGIIDIQKADPIAACHATLVFLLIAVLLVLFYVVSFQVESKLRAQYCTERRYFSTARDINAYRMPVGQLLLWIIFALMCLWRLTEFGFIRGDA